MPPKRLMTASQVEKQGLQLVLKHSVEDQNRLSSKLRESHDQMMMLLATLDRQKAQIREHIAFRRAQAAQISDAMERIEVLRSENQHVKASMAQESDASSKHAALLKQHFADKSDECKELKREVRDAQQDLDDQRQRYEARVSQLDKQRAGLEQLLERKTAECDRTSSTMKKQELELKERVYALQADKAKLQGEIKATERVKVDNAELKRQLDALTQRFETLREKSVRDVEARAQLEGQLKLAQPRVDKAQAEAERCRTKLASLQKQQNADLERVVREAKESSLKAAAQFQRVTEEKRAMAERLAALEGVGTRLEESKAKTETLKKSKALLKQELKMVRTSAGDLERQFKAALLECEALRKDKAGLESTVRGLRENLSAGQTANQDLRARNAELRTEVERSMSKFAEHLSATDKQRTSQNEEFTKVYGEFKHNNCLAQELRKQLQQQKEQYEALLAAERANVQKRVRELVAKEAPRAVARAQEAERLRDRAVEQVAELGAFCARRQRRLGTAARTRAAWAEWRARTWQKKCERALEEGGRRPVVGVAQAPGAQKAEESVEPSADELLARRRTEELEELQKRRTRLFGDLMRQMRGVGQVIEDSSPELGSTNPSAGLLGRSIDTLQSTIDGYHEFVSSNPIQSEGKRSAGPSPAPMTRTLNAMTVESAQLSQSIAALMNAMGEGAAGAARSMS